MKKILEKKKGSPMINKLYRFLQTSNLSRATDCVLFAWAGRPVGSIVEWSALS